MKTCTYCGTKYSDDTTECPIDGNLVSGEPVVAELEQPNWVTLVNCGTLVSADLAASKLRAAGIATFIPDEFQAITFNVNTSGYIRVQVAPKDYEAAKALLADSDQDS